MENQLFDPETPMPNPGFVVTSPPPPSCASLVRAFPLADVVNPVRSILLGAWDVPSNETVRDCKLQLISLGPLMFLFWPAVYTGGTKVHAITLKIDMDVLASRVHSWDQST